MKPVLFLKFPYSSQYGGGERHTLLLADALGAAGTRVFFAGSCSVLFAAFRKRRRPALRWWAGKEPVAVWSLLVFPLTAVPALLGLVGSLAFFIWRRGVGTIYCLSLTEKILLTPFARMLGVRVLWAEHISGSARRWLRRNPLRPFFATWSRWATLVSVSNEVTESMVRLGVPRRRIVTVYNGVDAAPFQDFHRRTSHWTKQFVLGSIGRLEPEKGYTVLLRAFHTLLSFLPHARLILVGDGSERRQLEWLARQLRIEHSVQFVGFQEQTAGWYKNFDCFVLPSVGREAFGIVLLEALAAACPVVASRLGGVTEIIQDQVNGLLVEPGNSEALVQAMLWVYQHPDLALQLGYAGQQMVMERFTIQAMLAQLLRLFP